MVSVPKRAPGQSESREPERARQTLVPSLIKLRHDTTVAQAKFVLDGMHRILIEHPFVDPASVRVRLRGFAASSLELDIVAYLKAKNKNHFFELQEELLLLYMETIQAAGTQLAFQAAVYVSATPPGVKPVAP